MSRLRLIPLVLVLLAVAWSVVGAVPFGAPDPGPPAALLAGPDRVFVTTLDPDRFASASWVQVLPVDAPPPSLGERWVVAPGVALPQPAGGTRFETTRLAAGWRAVRVVALSGEDAEPSAPDARSRRLLHEEVRDARVALVDADGRTRACNRWRFGRWDCGPAPWNFVGLEELTIQDRPATCLWLHPVEGERWVITWPDVPPARLSGRSGMADVAANNERPGGISYRVLWGDEVVLEREHPQQRGWRRFSSRLEPAAAEGSSEPAEPASASRPLTVEVWADEVAQRQFCMDLTLHIAGGTR